MSTLGLFLGYSWLYRGRTCACLVWAHVIGVDDVDVEAATEVGPLGTHALTEFVLHAPRAEVSDHVYNTEVIALAELLWHQELWSLPSESVPLPARYTKMRERP